MRRLLTSAEMGLCDRSASVRFGIPSLLLMENAGRAVVDAVCRHFGDLERRQVVIVAGRGNNGGDGYVAARHLTQLGASVTVVRSGESSRKGGDAALNSNIFKRISSDPIQREHAVIIGSTSRKMKLLPKPDVIIDALFGTGLTGKISPSDALLIRWMNSFGVPVVSVDIPSGLDADSGMPLGGAVKASVTVTFGWKKIGLIRGEARRYAGIVEVADISLPAGVLNQLKGAPVFEAEPGDIRKLLPERPVQAHKNCVGKVLVLAGSTGLTGAAALCSNAALKAGAGVVLLAAPSGVADILARKLTEVMVFPVEDGGTGMFGPESFEQVAQKVSWADIVLLGPGLSITERSSDFVLNVLGNCAKPMVIDADGLNAISGFGREFFRRRRGDFIITPHVGEFSRLSRIPAAEIEPDRVNIASKFGLLNRLTLVLKGSPTVIADEKGPVVVNPTGNPGMATAGSGDVLCGVIAGLWAQGMSRHDAAVAGAYLHGLAGDLAASKYGMRSMMAGDVLEHLADAFKAVEDMRK